MNWEKLRSPANTTFKNYNFQFVCELGKPWKYNLRPIFKSPNLNLWMNLESLCINPSFIIENKIGNLHKADHISNFSTNV